MGLGGSRDAEEREPDPSSPEMVSTAGSIDNKGMTVHGVISDVHDQDVRGDRGFTRVDAPALSPSLTVPIYGWCAGRSISF